MAATPKRVERGMSREGGLAFLAAALAFTGNLRTCPAGFGQADGDCLFPAGDLLPGAAAPKRSAFPLAHRFFDFLRRLLAVLSTTTLLRHQSPPVRYLAIVSRLCSQPSKP